MLWAPLTSSCPKFDGEKAFAAIERFRVNGFYMPPILLKRLLQVPEETMSRYDVSTVKAIMSGGAACPTSVKKGHHGKVRPRFVDVASGIKRGGVSVIPWQVLKMFKNRATYIAQGELFAPFLAILTQPEGCDWSALAGVLRQPWHTFSRRVGQVLSSRCELSLNWLAPAAH